MRYRSTSSFLIATVLLFATGEIQAQVTTSPISNGSITASVGAGGGGGAIDDLVGPTIHGRLTLETRPFFWRIQPAATAEFWLLPLTCTPQDPTDPTECADHGWSVDVGGNVRVGTGERLSPYVGGGIGVAHAGELHPAVNIRTGVDWRALGRHALRTELRYQRTLGDNARNDLSASLGVRFLLPGR